MPNYKGRTPGTRRIVVWVKGRSHERIFEGSKAEGDAFEARWRVELEASVHETRVAPRFSPLCTEKYRPFAEANLARSTWSRRKYVIANLCGFFGQKKTTDFVMADVEAYKAFRQKQDAGPGTINGELRAFLTVLRWATETGYPVTIPPIRYLKEPEGRVRIWSLEELDALMTVARTKHPVILRLIVFLLNTGCRKGEALAAEWSWFDFKRGMISIPATKYWTPKSGRAREVTISDACREVTDLPKLARTSDRWVFPNRDAGAFEFFPDEIFKELENAAGISGGAHTLRHCFASNFLETTPDLYLLSQVLGHSHERITAIYAHLLPSHLEKSRNAVNIRPPAPTMARTMARGSRSAKTA